MLTKVSREGELAFRYIASKKEVIKHVPGKGIVDDRLPVIIDGLQGLGCCAVGPGMVTFCRLGCLAGDGFGSGRAPARQGPSGAPDSVWCTFSLPLMTLLRLCDEFSIVHSRGSAMPRD